MRMFTYGVIIFALAGCGLTLKKYDPVTLDQVEKTIAFERDAYLLTLKALEDGVLSEVERASILVRHDSEIARLEAWRKAESAKQTEDQP